MIVLLRTLALMHVLARLASTGVPMHCEPCWTHDPRTEAQLPANFTHEQWYAEPAIACWPRFRRRVRLHAARVLAVKLSTSFRVQVLAVAPSFPMAGYIAARDRNVWLLLLLFIAAFLCGRLWQVASEMDHQAEKWDP